MGMSFNSGNLGGPYQARPDLGPGVGFGAGLPQPEAQQDFGLDPATGLPFSSQPGPGLDIQGNQPAASMLPPGGMSGGMGGGKTTNMIPGQANTNAIFGGGQQQPITQGNGVLPPGFGELSPIDRSQIGPGAQIGMTGRPQPSPFMGRPQPSPFMGRPQASMAPRLPVAPVQSRLGSGQQAQFGGAGQLGSARANMLQGRGPFSNAVAARNRRR